MCGPVVIAFGTPEQKKRFLPRMAALDDWWCQGFSEPGAGSDLAGLKTTAVRQGDHYVVNGQKTWTTLAQYADWIFCLCRTDPGRQEAARHLVPADRHEDARHHRAPDPDHGRRPRGQRGVLRRRQGAGREPGRPGEPRLGLRQVPARQRAHRHRPRRLLQAARAAHQGAGLARHGRRQAADGGRALPREGGRRRGRAQGAGDDADARARRGPATQGPDCPIPKSSILKIKGSEIQQATTQLLLEIAGPLALPYQPDSDDAQFGSNEPPEDLEWAAPAAPAYFNYRKTTIYGGSNEIQRNILAKAVLGF